MLESHELVGLGLGALWVSRSFTETKRERERSNTVGGVVDRLVLGEGDSECVCRWEGEREVEMRKREIRE